LIGFRRNPDVVDAGHAPGFLQAFRLAKHAAMADGDHHHAGR
jgi:hypothetical protein